MPNVPTSLPITLLGGNYEKPNTFAFMQNPDLQYMPMSVFTNSKGQVDYNSYWGAHDKFIAQRLIDINNTKWSSDVFRFQLERAENNLYNNRNAWGSLADIMEKGGNILAFDTETIGTFTEELIENNIENKAATRAGITEIGFAIQHHKGINGYQGARTVSDPPGSFFFGIDPQQREWLEEVLQKKIRQEKLTSTEISAMERASRHSTLGSTGFSTFTGEWNGQTYTFVKQLNESRPDSIEHIKSGIEAMSAKYVENRDEQISGLISYIDSFTKNGQNRAVVGQNLPYDTNVMNRYAALHNLTHDVKAGNKTVLKDIVGLSTVDNSSFLNSIEKQVRKNLQGQSEEAIQKEINNQIFAKSFQYADSMFALRAYANANNTTVGEIVKQINPGITNSRLGSLEALTEAITSSTSYTTSLAHNAFEDSIATLKIFEHIGGDIQDKTHLNVVQRAISVLNQIKETPNTITLEDSLIKINSKGNIRSQDILVMDNQVTTGYQTANQYWRFSGIGSTDYTGVEYNGKVVAETANKYIARFESANNDGATLFKAFDNEEDFKAWLTNHTSLVKYASPDALASGIALQTQIHDRDIARRVIDGFFDVGQVSAYTRSGSGSVIDAGGFVSFQKYYSMYKDLTSLSEEAISSMHLSDVSGKEITTATQLIKNIGYGDNIAGVIDYADKNGLESITSHFRTSKASKAMTVHEAGIKSYDQRKIMQQVFGMFDENKEFFEFANNKIPALKDNLTQTIAFNNIREQYINQPSVKNALRRAKEQAKQDVQYSIVDRNSVSIATRSGSYTRVDITDVKHGTSQLFNAFNDKSLSNAQVAGRLLGVADDLKKRGLISADDVEVIKKVHGAGNQPYAVAESIVSRLGDPFNQINTTMADRHPGGSLLDSATSEMTLVSGTFSKTAQEQAKSTIAYLDGTVLLSGGFDNTTEFIGSQRIDTDNFAAIRNTLLSMHYDEESIQEFSSIYFTNGKGKSNLARFNENLGEGQAEVRPLFFRSQKDEASAFAIFTRKQDQADVMDILSNLDKNATNREVKEALQGKASYFEIPYLEVFDVGENNVIRQLSGGAKDSSGVWQGGHGARVVFVKQGDDFYRYDTFSFSMYEKDGVITGGIKDQGGSYLTSVRQRAELAYAAESLGEHQKATSALNNPNIARMTEEAAPQMNGIKVNGKLIKGHAVSVKDIDYAHTIALDPGEGGLGLLDLMKELTSDTSYAKVTKASSSETASNALRGIYKAFADEYGLLTYDQKNLYGSAALDKVYGSEPFKHFYQRYLTSQTGGIGSDRNIIEGILNGTNTHNLLEPEVKAIKALRNDSLLQIMAQASDHNEYISDSLTKALNILAYDAQLNAVGSESYAHKNMMYVGGYSPSIMNNSGTSGIIRPTYTQRGNYRSYKLNGEYFHDAEGMANRLGIKFGDAYTTNQYIDFISKLDQAELDKVGEAVTANTVSRRNIIGAVQSISDTEIRIGKEDAIKYMLDNANGMDTDALKKVYERMVNDINTYEGKAYVRPSVANQEFFALGDPKNIKSAQIRNVFEIGTEAEQQETVRVLNDLVGKKVKDGTVIGRQLRNDGSFKDIIYHGQTIHEFTEQNAKELMSKGKTQAIVERQLEGFKIMFGEEKATAETFAYYTSIDPVKRAREVQETMRSVGLENKISGSLVDTSKSYSKNELKNIQKHMLKNIHTLDQYTDLAMDAITRANQSGFKTIAIGNNNIAKHLSDTAIDSRWNIIAMTFRGEDGHNQLRELAKNIKLPDNTAFIDHLGYNGVYDTLTFDNPLDNGSINTLDSLITKMRASENPLAQKAVQTIDMFEKNNIALQSIQRQQMNTFQGQAFKMDQRMYQTLVMQDFGNYTGARESSGGQLAELIRRQITNGYYDNIANIAGLQGVTESYQNINNVWGDIVRTRRGILAPHLESRMVGGTLDAIDFINGKFDVDTKNIIKIDAADLLSNIPKGGGVDAYSNFIFMVDGEPTPYLRSLANFGTNAATLDFGSNSFYLDLSKYGKFDFNGRKGLTGIVLPYQFLNSSDEELFLGESTKETMKFFRTIQGLSEGNPNNAKTISAALEDLFKAYGEELSDSNKDSLLTKSLYKMKMPNSSGALAKDAIVPTVPLTREEIYGIRSLEYDITHSLDINGRVDSTKLKQLGALLEERSIKLGLAKEAIQKETGDVVSKLNITSGNKKYAQYLRSYKPDLTLNGDIIENAVTVSKEMFQATEMDTGHIGWQLVQDYFGETSKGKARKARAGLERFDDISRFHYKVDAHNVAFNYVDDLQYEASHFVITNQELLNIINDLEDTFKGTNHSDWARETSYALNRILEGNEDYFVRQQKVVKSLNERVGEYLNQIDARSGIDEALNPNIIAEDRRAFLMQMNSIFEEVGDRYAREVGILGMTGRYPFFNETGVLPVRIYLDDAVHGKEIRFLGPQFSILQNLDFDGDTEFLKFLGNGGLLAKDAQETVLLNTQFNKMNQLNVSIFADSLDDSLKAYRYGDESLFKASLLKDLDRASYDRAASQFLGALSKEDLALVEAKGNEDLKDLLIAHSKSMKQFYQDFDIKHGRSVNNPDMIKAAIQARLAKEYIGNYSKPNLEIRNAMTYMMSLANDDELKTLRNIRDSLFRYADLDANGGIIKAKPMGLLTLLEQKGIDTKHVHDAATLNNSSAWRVGVSELFNNAKGAEQIDSKKIQQSMVDLVEGARKVFFSESTQSNTEIATEIMGKSFGSWTDLVQNADKVSDELLGKQYLSALYTMSQMDNAYEGFHGTFRSKYYKNLSAGIQDMTDAELDKLIRGNYTLDVPMRNFLKSAKFQKIKTDDLFKVNGRAVQEGDIFAYAGEDGPIGVVFKGFIHDDSTKNGAVRVMANKFDFVTGEELGEIKGWGYRKGQHAALTIRELNENIKQYGNSALLDLTDIDTPERNLNVRDISLGNDVLKGTSMTRNNISNVQHSVASLYTESNLQWFFENTNSPEFESRFKAVLSSETIMPLYNGNTRLGVTFGQIIGEETDVEAFRRRIIDLNERIQYGVEHGQITGSQDAKELIRAINKDIAANPRQNIGRITGGTAEDTIKEYLNNASVENTVKLTDNIEFLSRSLSEVRQSNQIIQTIDSRIATRNARVEEIAGQYYRNITQGSQAQETAFDTARKAWEQEIKESSEAIFGALRTATNAEEEMFYRFNWNKFSKNSDFIIDLKHAKIGSVDSRIFDAQVGFGQFIGTKISDLSGTQIEQIRKEIEMAMPNLADKSLEKIAARNTNELLSSLGRISNAEQLGNQVVTLSFDNADALMKTYKAVFNPETGERFAQGVAEESIQQAKEATAKAAREASENIEKKTLLKDVKSTFKNMSPATKTKLAIGAGVVGGVAALGLAGHALFNNDSSKNVEVPNSIGDQLESQGVKIRNKSNAHYSSAPTDAQATQRQKNVAPPSMPKNRTIYHDAGSGFNFKVSAQSFNKLQAESYQRMMQNTGLNNGQINISRDNSRITDNWLENKFAQLTE